MNKASASDDKTPPLYIAAQRGYGDVVEQLLEAGADVNKASADYGTPLYIAAQQGYEGVVKQLLKAGAADPNADERSSGRHRPPSVWPPSVVTYEGSARSFSRPERT